MNKLQICKQCVARRVVKGLLPNMPQLGVNKMNEDLTKLLFLYKL